MQKTIFNIVLTIGLLLSYLAQAQGTLYVSNVGLTVAGGSVVGSDKWIAQNFTTGIDSGGYSLDSIQLLMDGASGNPSGFSVSIYSSLVNGVPGSSLGILSGSDPAADGVFSYTTSGITLSPSSSYFVVVTAATPVSTSEYGWSLTGSSSSSNQWGIDTVNATSANGSSWVLADGKGAFQMAIYATAVPEPAVLNLFGAFILFMWLFMK